MIHNTFFFMTDKFTKPSDSWMYPLCIKVHDVDNDDVNNP